jgi:hypothetical protein
MFDETLIKIGGIFHLICAMSHLLFPKVFNWQDNLRELPIIKQKKIKQILNISNLSTMMFWLILSYIPFFYSYELITTQIGKALLTFIIIFWVVRIFVLQTVIVGIKSKESWFRIPFFFAGLIFFLIPWVRVMFHI